MFGLGTDTESGQVVPPPKQKAAFATGTTQPVAAPAAATAPAGRTMLGLPMPSASDPSASDPSAASDKGTAPAAAAAPAGRTMLGLPMPSASDPSAASDKGAVPAAAAAPVKAAVPTTASQAASVESGRTMLGVGLAQDPAAPAARAPTLAVAADGEQQYLPAARSGGSGKAAALVTVVGLLAVGAGAALYLFGKADKPGITAKVVTVENSDALRFEVPGAPPGSKLRFGGQEKVLQAGRMPCAWAITWRRSTWSTRTER